MFNSIIFEFIKDLYKSKSIISIYKDLGTFVRYSNYSLTEIHQFIPYEFDIYYSIFLKQLQDEKKK